MKPATKKFLVFGALSAVGAGVLIAFTTKANASERGIEEDEEIKITPPGASGLPDGSVPDVVAPGTSEDSLLHEDERPFETGVGPTTPDMSEHENPIDPSAGLPEEDVPEIVKQLVPPIAEREIEADADPNGTVLLARLLLARENAPGWKSDLSADIAEWQSKVGLNPDGKFGLESVTKMAEEVGVLPIVRSWTIGKHWDKASAIKDYRHNIMRVMTELGRYSPLSDAHVEALKLSMDREKGQAFDGDTRALSTLEDVAKLNAKLEALANRQAQEAINRESD